MSNNNKPVSQADKQSHKYLDPLRHSCAHLLAAAVLELYPETLPTIGPSIENGFYYDFEFKEAISDDDLKKIEKKMKEMVKTWKNFERIEVSKKEALKQFKNNQYKLELINEFAEEGQKITMYKSGEFTDLCRGGHIENPSKELRSFKLLSLAGAYWRGDEKNKMLTRIYGTAFGTKDELHKHLEQLKEAKKRDHKKLGKELGLFTFSDLVGAGMPLFTPKGTAVRDQLEGYVTSLNKKHGYQKVWIPHLAKPELYKTSGHWDKFSDDLFHVKGANDEFVIKPMNCPHHTQIYASEARSYKDLPVRLHETTTNYRDEKSGQLAGLTRVRSITQDDGHSFITPDQIEKEFNILLSIQRSVLESVGLDNYWISLSLSDPDNMDKYLGDKKTWEKSEKIMEDILKKKKIEYKPVKGEAAFYGPKMDLMARDAIGREWQLSTIQLDFNMPKRFNLEYTDADNKKKTPIMIHRAFMGATERFMGVIIEHFAGAFPVWLAPVQIQIIPVSEGHHEHAHTLAEEFMKNEFRISVDDANETVGNKIRKATKMKVPYMLVIGDKEMSSKSLHIRRRGSEEISEMPKKTFIDQVTKEIENKTIW